MSSPKRSSISDSDVLLCKAFEAWISTQHSDYRDNQDHLLIILVLVFFISGLNDQTQNNGQRRFKAIGLLFS